MKSKQGQSSKSDRKRRPVSITNTRSALVFPAADHGQILSFSRLPDHSTARSLRQMAVLDMQRRYGNAHVRQILNPTLSGGRAGNIVQMAGSQAEEIGLGSAMSLGRFASGADDVRRRWTALGTPQQRLRELDKIATAELRKVGVHPCRMLAKSMGKTDEGLFTASNWTIAINRNFLKGTTITAGKMNTLAAAVYHEARHAEQNFLVAKFLASQGKSAWGIKKKTGIQYKVARLAKKAEKQKPLDAAQRAAAKTWYESLYGPKSKQSKVFKTLSKTEKRFDLWNKKSKKLKKEYKALVGKIKKHKGKLQAAMAESTLALFDLTSAKKPSKAAKLKVKKAEQKQTKLTKALKKLNAAKKKLLAKTKIITRKFERARQKYLKAYRAYRNLADEADAFKVEARLKQAISAIRSIKVPTLKRPMKGMGKALKATIKGLVSP